MRRQQQGPYSKDLSEALLNSGVCSDRDHIQRLYDLVKTHSQVYRATQAQEDHLRLHVGSAHVAVPLGQDLQDVEDGLWTMQPVVKISPGVTSKENRHAAEQKTDYAWNRAARKWAKTE